MMQVVSIGGSPSLRSRSGLLLEQAGNWLQARGIQVACGAWFNQNGWGDFAGREAAPDIVAWLANAMDISLEEQQEEGVLV